MKNSYKTCGTCANRETCRKTVGYRFGFCATDYAPDYHMLAIDMINCLADMVTEYAGESGSLARSLADAYGTGTMNVLGLGWLTDLLEDEPEDDDEAAWHDGSETSCSACPDNECTGHCMSCGYRPF